MRLTICDLCDEPIVGIRLLVQASVPNASWGTNDITLDVCSDCLCNSLVIAEINRRLQLRRKEVEEACSAFA
jgi:hypothetical protein